jgi:hypothetical protein
VFRLRTVKVLLLATLLLTPGLAGAQELYTFTGSLLVGVGGSFDENDAGYGNTTFQLGISNVIEKRTHLGIRLGMMDFGSRDRLGPITGADVTYLTIAGEYRSKKSSYTGKFVDSGIYVGLGGYQIEGTDAAGREDDETAIGLAIGLTGDWEITPKWGVRVELSGHILDSDIADTLGMFHLGAAYRF